MNDVPALRLAETDWGALQQMVYCRKISDIDQLKRVLIDCWAQLSQDTLNRAIDQLPKKTDDGHQGKGCPRGVSSGLTLWENDSCFTVC